MSTRPAILIARKVFPEVVAKLREHFDVDTNEDDAPLTPAQLAARLGPQLSYILKVGVTHHDESEGTPGAGPKPVWFFAPDAAAALIGEIGPDAFQSAVADRWSGFVADADGWVTIDRKTGSDALQQVWRDQVAGRAKPDVGYIMRW